MKPSSFHVSGQRLNAVHWEVYADQGGSFVVRVSTPRALLTLLAKESQMDGTSRPRVVRESHSHIHPGFAFDVLYATMLLSTVGLCPFNGQT